MKRRRPAESYSKEAEREAGWTMQVAFQWTAASSVFAFIVGGALAGVSVGLL